METNSGSLGLDRDRARVEALTGPAERGGIGGPLSCERGAGGSNWDVVSDSADTVSGAGGGNLDVGGALVGLEAVMTEGVTWLSEYRRARFLLDGGDLKTVEGSSVYCVRASER
jgi:hypothetical protein